MNGFKFVSLLGNHDLYNNIPIIMITTRGAKEDEQNAMTIGANAYITKSVKAHDLIRLVNNYISTLLWS